MRVPIPPRFWLPGIVLALFAPDSLVLAQSHFWGNERIRNRPRNEMQTPPTRFEDMEGYARNPVIGKIVWVDDTGRYAVAWLDRPMPLQDRPLGTHNDTLEPRALLRLIQHKDNARAVGLLVERGDTQPGQQLILPGAAMTERLRNLMPRPAPVESKVDATVPEAKEASPEK